MKKALLIAAALGALSLPALAQQSPTGQSSGGPARAGVPGQVGGGTAAAGAGMSTSGAGMSGAAGMETEKAAPRKSRKVSKKKSRSMH
ncbi:MAG TPA: hypothetical protein VGO82_11575 [Enterovirga sp.]|jgi:hypothetical protein|nr:hypothetical protein [Enterovirga sp.]